jgi:hypothetical protein
MFLRPALIIASALVVAIALPAEAAHKKAKNNGLMTQSVGSQDAATDQLNNQSLARAKSGQNALTPGADSTANLNSMSQGAASQGRNMGGSAPMPFK